MTEEEFLSLNDIGYEAKPLEVTLIVIYGIITTIGLVANGIVFFIIFARNEISKF